MSKKFIRYNDTALKWAIKYLDPYEFKVYTYLLSIIIRPNTEKDLKGNNQYELWNCFHNGRLLPVNVGYENIIKTTGVSRKMVKQSLNKLDSIGAIIRFSCRGRDRKNNFYLVGIHYLNNREPVRYFSEFKDIIEGGKMSDNLRKHIIQNRHDKNKLLGEKTEDKLTVGSYFNVNHDQFQSSVRALEVSVPKLCGDRLLDTDS